MFRSKDMTLNRIMFAKNSTWETMNYLANTEKVMMNLPSTYIKYEGQNDSSMYAAKMINRCDDLLDKLQVINEKLTEFGWPISKMKNSVSDYIKLIDEKRIEESVKGQELFLNEEGNFNEKFLILNDHLNNYDSIIEQRIKFLEKAQSLGDIEELVPFDFYANFNGNEDDEKRGTKKFHSIIGLVPTKNIFKLQKILFRVSRENIVMKTKNLQKIKDSFLKKKNNEEKSLIFLLFPKTDKEFIIERVNKLLIHNEFTELPYTRPQDKNSQALSLKKELNDNEKILIQTKSKINDILKSFSISEKIENLSNIHYLTLIIKREQSFAKNLIYLEEKDGFNILQLWISKDEQEKITKDLSELKKSDKSFIQPKLEEISYSDKTPPTLFSENEFTKTFQSVVDTYGIPRYKEANPGLFTIVTFPFLFGVMFGDIGHGLILFCFGLYLIFGITNKMDPLYNLKYLITFMGVFAIFCGGIYNEFFAIPFAVQPSCYEKKGADFVLKDKDCVYGFGTDWVWAQSLNETAFVNSFKMKFSIIAGVVQMLLGIILKGSNGFYFGSLVDVFFEAIPQFIFMSVTFGYMSFCIIIKWLQNWDGKDPVSIIQLFINFLTVKDQLFATPEVQETIQTVFTVVCFICMILMLFPKPIILYIREKNQHNKKIKVSHLANEDINENLMETDEQDNKKNLSDISEENKEEVEGFGEFFVHQMIETIEFVLGSISNTASYLRLWALSLAHGQLAKVFLDMIFGWTIKDSESSIVSSFVIIIGFVFFFMVTLAVILIMDTMECFLHALRLHWVEFQNKFFKGDGKLFEPFKHQML